MKPSEQMHLQNTRSQTAKIPQQELFQTMSMGFLQKLEIC